MTEEFRIESGKAFCLQSVSTKRYLRVEEDQRLSAGGCHAFLLQSGVEKDRVTFIVTLGAGSEDAPLAFGANVLIRSAEGWLTAGTRGEVFGEKVTDEEKGMSKFRRWTLVARKPAVGQREIYCTDEVLLKSAFGHYLAAEGAHLVARSAAVGETGAWLLHAASRLPLPEWALARAGQWPGPPLPGLELWSAQDAWCGTQPAPRLRFESLREAEDHVLEELLFALMGASGQLIVRDAEGAWSLTQAEQLEPGFAALISRMLPTATLIERVHRFQRRHAQAAATLQLQGLAGGLASLRTEFLTLLHGFETQLRHRELDASRLLLGLAPAQKTWAFLARLVDELQSGTPPLSVLSRCVQAAPDDQAAAMFRMLFVTAARPLLAQLHRWVFHGALDDNRGEFFVADTRNGEFDGFKLMGDRVPEHLRGSAQKAFEAGRLVALLRSCEPNRSIDGGELLTAAALAPESSVVPAAVEAAFQRAQEAVLRLFAEKERLFERLEATRLFFFLGAADFLIHFLDLAESELRKPARAVSVEKLQNFFELAVRGSSAATALFREDFAVALAAELLPESFEGAGRGEAGERAAAGRRGYDLLTLRCTAPGPNALFFGAENLARYQLIFRHLFLLKFFERQLCAAWLAFQEHRELAGPHLRIARWISHKALCLAKALLHHALYEALHPLFERAAAEMRGATTFARLRAAHAEMLEAALRETLLVDRRYRSAVWTLCLFFGFLADHNRELLRSHFAADYRVLLATEEGGRRALAAEKERRLSELVTQSAFPAELAKINKKLNELRANVLKVLLERQSESGGLASLIDAFGHEDIAD